MIRHYNWTDSEGNRGRVAVALGDRDVLTIGQLAGRALPAGGLLPLLRVFSEDAAEEGLWQTLAKAIVTKGHPSPTSQGDLFLRAVELHNGRTKPWAVETRIGMSGCQDTLLRILRNPALGDCPIVARIHISMNEKLNQGVSLWLGDLIPLTDAAGGCLDGEVITFTPAEVFIPPEWHYGGQRPGVDPGPPIVEIIKRGGYATAD